MIFMATLTMQHELIPWPCNNNIDTETAKIEHKKFKKKKISNHNATLFYKTYNSIWVISKHFDMDIGFATVDIVKNEFDVIRHFNF